MLPDIGATELMVIAAIALIVVGPKDLPVLMRKVGQFLARMRGMAAEFRASFDEMARQSELDELRREVQALRSGDYLAQTQAAAGASQAAVEDVFYEIDQDLRALPGDAAPDSDSPPDPELMAEAQAEAPPAVPKKPRARKPKPAPEAEA